jgi:magnesium-transporting ATPase (P-type)
MAELRCRFVLQEHRPLHDAVLGTSSRSFYVVNVACSPWPQFSFFNNFSGQIAYESWTLSFYNVVFTVLPPFVIGVFDQFVSARMLDRYPQLYTLGQTNAFFTRTAFWLWVANALYHSLVGAYQTFACGVTLTYRTGFVRFFDYHVLGRPQAGKWSRHGALVLGHDTIPRRLAYRAGQSSANIRVSHIHLTLSRSHPTLSSVWTKYTVAGTH